MTAGDASDERPAPPSMDRIEAYRRAPARPPVAVQVGQVFVDLTNLFTLTARDSPLARGAALALAHGALRLAVTPVAHADDRDGRSAVLRETVMPALVDAGLDHAVGLVEAALAHDGDPARLGRGVERPQ